MTGSSQGGGVCANAVLFFCHDIKITTKLQNSQPGEPSEDKLNRTPITKDIKKKPCQAYQERLAQPPQASGV